MGITREMSKILSTSTAITTDAEISAYNYLSQSTASATYLNQTAYQPGLVLIRPTSVVNGTIGTNGTVTFSGTTSVSLNGVFSSEYSKYKILYDATLSINDGLYFRLRQNGTDSTASIYGSQVLRADGTSAAAVADTMQMYFVQQGLTHTANTSYDGLTLLTGTATTATGSISVYGYRL